MRVTATILTTQFTCPYLRYVLYEAKQPLPVLGTRRRFGNVVHAARAAYELHGRSIEHALQVLDERGAGLSEREVREARAILSWTHDRRERAEGRPILVEGPLSTPIADHLLHVRMDRLDSTREGLLLAEYKTGCRVHVELVRAQFRILSYAVARVFGRVPAIWELEILGQRRVERLEAVADLGALERFTAALAIAVAEGKRDPEPFDSSFCKRCPAREYCPRFSTNPKPLLARPPDRGIQLALF